MALAFAWSVWRPAASGGLSRTGVAALALLLFESLAAPLPMTVVDVPEVYREIAATPSGVGDAVVHVPDLPSREKLLYQTVHGKPVAGNVIGAVPHRSPSADAAIRDPAWSLLLRDFGALPPAERAGAVEAVREVLARSGVRWIVVSSSAWVHEARGASRHALLPSGARAALLTNLRALDPVGERTVGEETVLELARSGSLGN
jgi:hypothetical protein